VLRLASAGVHLRRALLLFAIVLGLAAIVTSITRPGDDRQERQPPPPAPAQEAAPKRDSANAEVKQLRFEATGKPRAQRLALGRPAVVIVEADQPGQVDVEGLGLTAPTAPETPARFDVLADEAGRYELRFTPAGRDESELAGTLVVKAPDA
jgi:hypothetical protein